MSKAFLVLSRCSGDVNLVMERGHVQNTETVIEVPKKFHGLGAGENKCGVS